MIVKLNTQRLQTLDEIRAFLDGSSPLDFTVPSRQETYGWIAASLRQLAYLRLAKTDKGVINHRVAKLLEKLRIELAKSRARQSNDNALVEIKNGSIVRKHLGYAHIPGRFAQRVNAITVGVLSPYLNFHRPCLFPEEIVDARGKRRKRYPYANLMNPYEKLKSLPEAAARLKPGIKFEHLDDIALQHSDNDAARLLNQARTELFRHINRARQPAA